MSNRETQEGAKAGESSGVGANEDDAGIVEFSGDSALSGAGQNIVMEPPSAVGQPIQPPAALNIDEARSSLHPDVVQFVQMPKSHVNHTYRNYSNTPRNADYTMPTEIQQMSFHEKIYHLLTFSKSVYREAIKWSAHGRAFEIVDTTKLSRLGILRLYFGSNIVPQFRKQLHNHGYKQLTKHIGGVEAYYSEFLLRGLPDLLFLSPEPFDCRTLLPDPVNEPNFIEISRLYPLPGEQRRLVEEARSQLSAKGILISETIFQDVADRWARK